MNAILASGSVKAAAKDLRIGLKTLYAKFGPEIVGLSAQARRQHAKTRVLNRYKSTARSLRYNPPVTPKALGAALYSRILDLWKTPKAFLIENAIEAGRNPLA